MYTANKITTGHLVSYNELITHNWTRRSAGMSQRGTKPNTSQGPTNRFISTGEYQAEVAWINRIPTIDGMLTADPSTYCGRCGLELSDTECKYGLTHCFKCLGVSEEKLVWLES